MKLTRLLAPESVAVVGASTRPGSYGNLAVANLVAAGFPGPVFGVHPTAGEVHGVRCYPRIRDLPVVPDAVVIATPAATVPALVAEAGEHGCGGAVVFAAGFAEVPGDAGRSLEGALAAAAAAYDMPVCGPNGNGIVAVAGRAPLWGDAYTPRRAGPIALISQSGNVAVNALLSTRALRLHTVVSCGNQAVVDAAGYLAALAETGGVRSVALYLEDEGDGARLAGALATCADAGIGVAVLKAGTSELGASAAAAHTGAVAGDARVLRALVEEAGGAWARNPHELLELAKTLAYGSRPARPNGDRHGKGTPDGKSTLHRPGAPDEIDIQEQPGEPDHQGTHDRKDSQQGHGAPHGIDMQKQRGVPDHQDTGDGRGVLIVTCSGGDAAVGADEAARLGVPLPPLSPPTRSALLPVLPPTATPGNPLDYTAVIFGDTRRTAGLITVAAADEALGPVLVYYDRPARMSDDAAVEWDGALAGVIEAASGLEGRVIVASTLPELMPEETAERLADHGIIPISGLSEGIVCAGALLTPLGDGDRLREIASAARTSPRARDPYDTDGTLRTDRTDVTDGGDHTDGTDGRDEAGWLAEHEAKALLREHGIPVPAGFVVHTPEEAVEASATLGTAVALKLSGRHLRHKTDLGALLLGVSGAEAVRQGVTTLLTSPAAAPGTTITPERAAPGTTITTEQTPPGKAVAAERAAPGMAVLVEEMVAQGVELLVAVRRDGVVPVLVLALGGTWVEVLDDVVLLPLPATPRRVVEALGRLRGASLLTGARGRPPVDLAALGELASRTGDLALAKNLTLVELNPVIATPEGATAVDALIQTGRRLIPDPDRTTGPDRTTPDPTP
ncbi:acetate--CoA ligase family protein [Sphaerisporangium sp. NBC_01403]|uniref:acetate--CoA ligase family protein n=1 Tax=Sphaerisporangium sp. NBC_01403 TaxID=2903599 RepID=UPI00324CF8AC